MPAMVVSIHINTRLLELWLKKHNASPMWVCILLFTPTMMLLMVIGCISLNMLLLAMFQDLI